MKIGYSEPTLTKDILSDGSTVYGVFISGDKDIQLHCLDQNAAENLISVWTHGVIDVEIN